MAEGNWYVNDGREGLRALAHFEEQIIIHDAMRKANLVYENDCAEAEAFIDRGIDFGAYRLRPGERCLISPGGIGSRYLGSKEPSVVLLDTDMNAFSVEQIIWNADDLHSRLEGTEYPSFLLNYLRRRERGFIGEVEV